MSSYRPSGMLLKVCVLTCAVGFLVISLPVWRDASVAAGQPQARKEVARPAPQISFPTAFKTAPPEPETIEIEAIRRERKTNNAKLMITFKPTTRLVEAIPIRVGEKTVLLKRVAGEKSRTFAGVVDFDFAAFASEQERRAELAKRGVKVGVFDRRRLMKEEPVEFVDPRSIRLGKFQIPLGAMNGTPAAVDPARELVLTDTSVVNDPGRTWDPCPNTSGGSGPSGTPMGVWTFGFLMTQMANQAVTGIDPSDFAQNWVNNWASNQTVNTFNIAARNSASSGINALVTSTWPKLSNGKLDLSQAPFRLLAIVNRVDLRQNLVYGGGSAGEGRFVFAWVNPNQCGSTLPFTVILEYGVPKSSCGALHAYAQQWANLGLIALGAPSFNDALQMITDQFTLAGENSAKPNGSALDQLRSNEIEMAGPWELREFHIMPGGQLQEATVAQTPDLSLNHTSTLTNYINNTLAAILAGTYQVPLTIGATPFQGGNAPNNPTVWSGNPVVSNNIARFDFSVTTCNGCHQGETQFSTTPPFLQIAPRAPGNPAVLSGFLTGETVNDPIVPAQQNTFNDLLRREQDLDSLLSSSCSAGGLLRGLVFKPLNMPH